MNEAQIFMEKMDALIANRDLTYKELERRLGLANGFFGKLRKRDTVPTLAKIDVIADYFHVSRSFLLNIEDVHGSGIKIPLLGRIAAESPIRASANIIGYEEITREMFEKGEFFALKIKGDGMSPDIQDGDKVIVLEQDDVENGQIAVVIINGDDAICREIRKTDNGVMLISRNPNYEPLIYPKSDAPIKIIGRVVEVRREL